MQTGCRRPAVLVGTPKIATELCQRSWAAPRVVDQAAVAEVQPSSAKLNISHATRPIVGFGLQQLYLRCAGEAQACVPFAGIAERPGQAGALKHDGGAGSSAGVAMLEEPLDQVQHRRGVSLMIRIGRAP